MKNLRIFCKFPILKNLENFEKFGKFLKGFLKNKCAAGENFFEKNFFCLLPGSKKIVVEKCNKKLKVRRRRKFFGV